MLYLLDNGNLQSIKRAYNLYPIHGVTTNPTIISKQGKNFLDILRDIRETIGMESMLHVQVLSMDGDKMVKEGEYLNNAIGGNLYIKVPVIPEGIRAIKILKDKGIKTTATAIFTAQQALMAAVAGAEFVAPYVNRIDNVSGDGVRVVGEILQLFKHYNLDAKVLAASFKNLQQVHSVSLTGAQSITASPEILDKILEHPLTDWSVNKFISDWEAVYGREKLTLDVK